MMLKHLLHRRLLKILLPMYIRLNPLHLLGSERSVLFGTGTTWPLCHSSKSMLSFQNSIMKLKWTFRFFGDMSLKALGGTMFRLGDLLWVRSFTDYMNYFQEGGTSSSYITSREFMLFIFLCKYSSCYSTLFQNVLRTLRHYLRLFQKGLPREAPFELVLEMCDDLYTLCIDFVCSTKHYWGWTTYCESSQSGVLTIWLLRFKLFPPLPVGVSWGSILFLVKGDVDQLWFCKELH